MTGAFADALRNVFAENAVGLASRGRLARTRDAVKKHPDYSEHGYFLAVEMAFKQWETMQNVGSPTGCHSTCRFRKFHPAQIRVVRQNHHIIRIDVCDPAWVRNARRRHVQVATQARSRESVSPSSA